MNTVHGESTPQSGSPLNFLRLAPSVEKAWVEEFVLEQRLLGVPGSAIGDALALIESHVAESEEPVREAFGDPKAYARESAPSRRIEERRDPRWLVGLGLGLVGLFVAGTGADEWLFGSGQIHVTAGLLVTGGFLVAAFVVLILATDALLRLAVERIWAFLGICAVYAVAAVAATLVLDASVGQWPAAPVTAVGVGLLVLSVVLQWPTAARGGLDDPIVGPGQQSDAERTAAAHSAAGFSDILAWLTVFLFPILTVLMVALSWVLDLMA